MSVYQKEKPEFLRESMESIYNQTVPTNDFVLICDGPLTEELDGLIEEIQEKFGRRLRVIRQAENRGLGYSLNLGVKECKNELIARMDSDDVAVSDRIEKQLKIFKQKDVDVVGSNIVEYDENMREALGTRNVPESNEDIRKYAKRRNPINHMSVCFKKSKVIECGNYMDMKGFEDYYLWIRMMRCECSFYNIQEELVKVRGGNSMMERRGGKSYVKNMIKFEKHVCGLHFISRLDCANNIVIRIAVSSVPNSARSFFYSKVLRGKRS